MGTECEGDSETLQMEGNLVPLHLVSHAPVQLLLSTPHPLTYSSAYPATTHSFIHYPGVPLPRHCIHPVTTSIHPSSLPLSSLFPSCFSFLPSWL